MPVPAQRCWDGDLGAGSLIHPERSTEEVGSRGGSDAM